MSKKLFFLMVLGAAMTGFFNIVEATGQRIYTKEDVGQLTAEQQRVLLAGIRSNERYAIDPSVTWYTAAQQYVYAPCNYDLYEDQE